MHWLKVIVVCLGGLMAVKLAAAAEPPPAESRIAELIEQLGHEEFAVREQAGEDLFKIGFPAYKQIDIATTHPDREIRYRAARLLVRIREADLARRLELFLQGKDEDTEYPIPAWNAFRTMFGDTRESREYYVAMQKAEADVLEEVENNPKGLSEMLSQRVVQIQQAMQFQKEQLSEGQVDALLFAGTQTELNQQTMAIIQSFCYQQQFREAISSEGPKKDFTRKLLGNWIERTEDQAAYQAMMLAMQYDLSEGLTPAVKILEAGNQQPYIQQFALLSVAKFGKADHIPLLQKSLDNVTVVNNSTVNGKRRQTQLRDVALASLVHLAKKDHKEFGFENLQEAHPYLFNVSTLGFEDDAKRDEAIKKWQAFAKDLPEAKPMQQPAAEQEKAAEKDEAQPQADKAEAKPQAAGGVQVLPPQAVVRPAIPLRAIRALPAIQPAQAPQP